MLVLSRKEETGITVTTSAGLVQFKVLEIRGNQVRLGITAPHDCQVLRDELLETNHENNTASG